VLQVLPLPPLPPPPPPLILFLPQLLRASSPEAILVLDGVRYAVGGLSGQTDYAFLNASLLPKFKAAAGAFHYVTHRIGAPTKRYEWTPGERHSDATLSWPPKGITLEVDFAAPAGAPAAHAAVVVTVVYAMYDNLPLFEKHVVVKANGAKVTVDQLSMDLLYVTNEAMGYWGHNEYGSITSGSNSGRIHMESEMARPAPGTTFLGSDARCKTCTAGSGGDLLLNSSYTLGPAAQIGQGGFHGGNFSSVHTYVLLHDTDDSERQGLAVRKMYRILAPQITENPTFMHLTDTSAAGIKKAVDQCAAAGT